jgi:hypothetical protein
MDPTTQLLLLLLIGAVVLVFILSIVYFIIKAKDRPKKEAKDDNSSTKGEKTGKSTKLETQSVFDFMEFDSVEDNMILQKGGKKYIMVIECQGVNYDLMSGMEKTGVEEGFVQFLNTLRHPIQLYIQTRTVNLESSIQGYKNRVKEIEATLFKMRQEYEQMKESGQYSKEQLEKLFYEITKQTNLYEYGRDIIYDTEKMSLNRNILNKKYYIVISYYVSELGKNEYDKSEIQSMAFSELYTRAQSVIRAISPCGVNGKILNSVELSELLYVAYNRDESEVYDLRKAIKAEYDSIYRTAPDVLDKKMKEIDQAIEQKAIQLATEKIEKFRSQKREIVEEKEQSIEELADEMAQLIIEQNKEFIGPDVANEAIAEIKREGGKVDEKKKTKRTRTRTAKSE